MKRMSLESFEEYQDRRRRADLIIDKKLKPWSFHKSTELYLDNQGIWRSKGMTYRKPKDEI